MVERVAHEDAAPPRTRRGTGTTTGPHGPPGRARKRTRKRSRKPSRKSGPKRGGTGLLRSGAALVLLAAGLTACGGGDGTPTLTWYTNPDDGGQAELAERCSRASGGRYKITTSVLPNDATQQREQLVRRLAAKDSGIDIMSLDPVYVAEAANAGFLRPFRADEARQFTEGVFPPAVENSTWEGKLYAAPFWANTQVLWYRKSVAQKAGVDPSAPDFTWDKMIDAAVRTGTTVGVQANKYEGYMVWINALVESAGGRIISEAEKGAEATIEIDSPAGRRAAEIVSKLARSPAASPSMSTDDEERSRFLLNGSRGGFMVNWGYIWRAENADADAGDIPKSIVSDLGWAPYPKVTPGQEAKPPFGGIELGISAYSEYKDTLAVEAIKCITSTENMKFYMLDSGNPAARAAVYDDPEIQREFPMAGLIRDSIDAAAPRPITPYYGDVSGAVQSRWHPAGAVNPASTPGASATFIRQVLRDEALL